MIETAESRKRLPISTDFLGKTFEDRPALLQWIADQAVRLTIQGEDETQDQFGLEGLVALIRGIAPLARLWPSPEGRQAQNRI